ncbi:uncharacterized [Tachysurus ichikawai]
MGRCKALWEFSREPVMLEVVLVSESADEQTSSPTSSSELHGAPGCSTFLTISSLVSLKTSQRVDSKGCTVYIKAMKAFPG